MARVTGENSEILSELLEVSRAQWRRGDWENLSQLKEGLLRNSLNRAELAILVAVALYQIGNITKARKLIDMSMRWGASKELVGRLLISGSYISLSRSANFVGDSKRALYFFEKAILSNDEYFQEKAEVISVKNHFQKKDIILSEKENNVKGKNKLLSGKRILIVLWFRNLLGGGLHENVRDTVNSILESSGEPVVICPKSDFGEELLASGIRVIQVDYEIIGFEKAIHDCLTGYDLVHCHPGPSRKVGIRLAEMANCPLVMTVHGRWDDGISGYIEKVDLVVVVSQFIRDNLLSKIPNAKSKIIFIPNGVDVLEFGNDELKGENFCASFVGRVDVDKKDGIDLLKKIWEKQAAKEIPLFKWRVAGDGPLLIDLKEFSKRTFDNDEHIEYMGWLNRKSLARLLHKTHFVIAAGRSGIESLASGCSTVFSGREGFMLVKNWKNFTDAAYSNFGGYGSHNLASSFEEVIDFLNECYTPSNKKYALSSRLISQHIEKYYNKSYVGEKIIHQYAGLIMGK